MSHSLFFVHKSSESIRNAATRRFLRSGLRPPVEMTIKRPVRVTSGISRNDARGSAKEKRGWPATSSSAPTLLTSSSKNSLITVQLLIKQRPIDAGNAACVALTMKIFPVFIGLSCQDGKVSDFLFSSKAVVANFATTGIPANSSFRALFTCLPPEILLYTFPGKFH